jgi:hypothetical protein
MVDMKAAVEATLFSLPNATDWCTVGWAAKRINRSVRTVRRLNRENTLRTYHPRVADGETPPILLWTADVEALREAYMRAGTLISKTGWRKGETPSTRKAS